MGNPCERNLCFLIFSQLVSRNASTFQPMRCLTCPFVRATRKQFVGPRCHGRHGIRLTTARPGALDFVGKSLQKRGVLFLLVSLEGLKQKPCNFFLWKVVFFFFAKKSNCFFFWKNPEASISLKRNLQKPWSRQGSFWKTNPVFCIPRLWWFLGKNHGKCGRCRGRRSWDPFTWDRNWDHWDLCTLSCIWAKMERFEDVKKWGMFPKIGGIYPLNHPF